MKVIHKAKLNRMGVTLIDMPGDSKVLKANVDMFDQICIWYEFNRDVAWNEERHFYIQPTGGLGYTEYSTYIDTVFEGNLVWHIIEVRGV